MTKPGLDLENTAWLHVVVPISVTTLFSPEFFVTLEDANDTGLSVQA